MTLPLTRIFSCLLLGALLGVPARAASVSTAFANLQQDADVPLAPDGRPGLGTGRTARECGQLLRSPSDEEQVLLTGLYELSSDILVLREMARRIYDRRGYFDGLERKPQAELADLHERFRSQLKQAPLVLYDGGRDAARLADMMLDLRFRLRIELFEIFAQDGSELRRGLALLGGSQDGYYDLKDGDARAITSRIDLVAARLRAVRSDLDALRERGDAGAPGAADPEWGQQLLALKKNTDEDARKRVVREVEGKLEQRKQRLSSVLFSPRLGPKLQGDLDKRRALLDQSAVHLERAKSYLMLPPFDKDPTPAVEDMSRAERHRYAFSEGLRGLDLDPLNEDLTYLTGMASAEFQDPRLSRAWFDRYLALRGIRSADHRTLRGRKLTPEEEHALEQVLGAIMGPGSGLGPR